VDPTQEGWQRELEQGHKDLGLGGVKLLPVYAGFRPDEHLHLLDLVAERRAMPLATGPGTRRRRRADGQ
jgi:hypothetical protein